MTFECNRCGFMVDDKDATVDDDFENYPYPCPTENCGGHLYTAQDLECIAECLLCGREFMIGEDGNELGFCETCINSKGFPYDLDAYYKDYDDGKVAFKDFETMSRGLLEPYRKGEGKSNEGQKVNKMGKEKESLMCPITREACMGEACGWFVIRTTIDGNMLTQCAMMTIADFYTAKIEQMWDDADED